MADAVNSPFYASVERLAARRGEVMKTWGPVTMDAVSVARFEEALGWPTYVALPPAILMQLGNETIDIHRDERPRETIDETLGNPVNGGATIRWLRSLCPGEAISGRVSLKDAYVRDGKSGPLAIVLIETTFLDTSDRPVAVSEKTTIYRGRI